MSSESPLIVDRIGAVARLTLNRPRAGNALDMEMAAQLMRAAIACDEDQSVRCVLLTGAGRLFCAGGDVGAFAAAGDGVGAMLKEITAYLHMAMSRLMRMDKPLVTAVNGPAAGAGFSMAIAGDIALAAQSAHFTLAYTALGLSPDGGSTWLLPRLVGLRLAQDLAITNRRVGAEEAARIGLVTRVAPDDSIADEALAVAVQLAGSATGAIGRTRNLLLSSFGSTLETQMEAEARALACGAALPHGREGVAAFTERRKPDFNR
jgi:2-(1,2-epoxy-1,2-dihydrophenyl)acetyl-CoA isomerase